jgi:hypothetical protein
MMSGLYVNQLEQQKTSRGRELLRADRLEDGKAANIAPPPTIGRDELIEIKSDEDGSVKVTVRQP